MHCVRCTRIFCCFDSEVAGRLFLRLGGLLNGFGDLVKLGGFYGWAFGGDGSGELASEADEI